MFGVKMHQRRDLVEGLTRAMIFSGQNQKRGQDQSSLANIMWPIAKYDVVGLFNKFSRVENSIQYIFDNI